MIPNQSQADIPNITRRDDMPINSYIPSIIEQNEDYVIINKPSYVRMYGEFDVTVEKLIWKWLGIQDNLKWVHRLDYATSGVLCVGLSKKFASAASFAFEKRRTEKTYLAVVRGHIKVDKIPLVDTKPLATVEKLSKKGLDCKGKRELWQVMAMEAGLDIHFAALQNLINGSGATDDATLAPLVDKTYDDFHKNHKLRKQLRKVLKSRGLYQSNPLPSMHSYYTLPPDTGVPLPADGTDFTAPLLEQDSVQSSGQEETVPLKYQKNSAGDRVTDGNDPHTGPLVVSAPPTLCVFRLRNENQTKEATTEDNSCGIVHITGPIQAVRGDFRMRVLDTSTGLALGGPPTSSERVDSGTGSCRDDAAAAAAAAAAELEESEADGEDWLHCETCMEVLGHGFYQGHAVTKVRLKPVSGRRHQLRLHCLLLGHPIVGDATYGPDDAPNESAERMMLHALSLRIDMGRSTQSTQTSSRKYRDTNSIINAESADPFLLDPYSRNVSVVS